MSKNTRSAAFRKVDVDQYNEERFEEEALVDDGVTGPNEGETQSMLNKGKPIDALQYVLNNSPVSSKNQSVKDKAVQVVLKVLLAFKTSEIDGAIKSLDQQQIDTLMKYVYRGFEFPSNGSSAQLLVWHEKVFAVGGLGSIVRVLTDTKKV